MITRTSALSFRDQVGRHHIHLRTGSYSGHEPPDVVAATLTLFQQFGVPYYLKCDIEGSDTYVARSLVREVANPTFCSIEATSLDDLAYLFAAGYASFQIVNQDVNRIVHPPQPSREGAFVEVHFNGQMSGLFGRELDASKWMSFEACCDLYLKFMAVKNVDRDLASGWIDVHSSRLSLQDLQQLA